MVRVLLKLFEKGKKKENAETKKVLLIKLYNLKYRAHDKNQFCNWMCRSTLKINYFHFLP